MLLNYSGTLRTFSRNIVLHLIAISLIGFTVDGGVFSVVFNLFLLRLGYGPEFVGQVNSAGLITFAVCSLPAGALGNLWGNRVAMIVGMSLMMVGSLLLSLAEFVPEGIQAAWLFATYMTSFGGVAVYFVNTAPFLMRETTAEQRNYAFAIQSAAISLAAFAGSFMGGFLPGIFASNMGLTLDSATPYRYPLLIAAILVSVGILALLATREDSATASIPQPLPPRPRRTYASHFRVPRVRGLTLSNLSRGFLVLLAVIAVIRVLQVGGMAVAMTFFNVYLDDGLGVPTSQVGILAGLGRLLGVPIVLSMPILSARWGNGRLVVWSSFSAALCLLPMALIPTWWAAGLGYMGVMAGSSIRYTAFMVYVMELVKPEQRSTMSAVSEMTAGLSFAGMALLGGYIIVGQGYSALFMIGAVATFLGTVLFWGYFRGANAER